MSFQILMFWSVSLLTYCLHYFSTVSVSVTVTRPSPPAAHIIILSQGRCISIIPLGAASVSALFCGPLLFAECITWAQWHTHSDLHTHHIHTVTHTHTHNSPLHTQQPLSCGTPCSKPLYLPHSVITPLQWDIFKVTGLKCGCVEACSRSNRFYHWLILIMFEV